MSEGCWAVVGYSDGIYVRVVYGAEIDAMRRMNNDRYGDHVIWLPWGVEPVTADKERPEP